MPQATKGLPKDGNNQTIQAPDSFRTTDAHATPKASPLAFSSTIIAITVPVNAIEFIVNPSTAMRISDAAAMASYDIIAAGTKESIPCADMTLIYIVRNTADGTLNFRFNLV